MKNRALIWLVAILAALGIVYLAASWYVGKLSQERLTTFVSQINQEFADQWSGEKSPEIKIIDYKKGLLTSLVTYQIKYYQGGSNPEQVLLIDKLSHGPFPVAAVGQGYFTPMIAYSQIKPMHGGAMQPWFELMADDDLPWLMKNKYYFSGAVNSNLVLNQFEDAASQIDFQGGQIQSDYEPESGQFKALGNLPGLSFMETSSDTLFDLQDIDINFSTIDSADQGLQSHQQVQLAKLSASWADGLNIMLEKPGFIIDSTHKDDLSHSKINYDLGQVVVGETKLGNIQAGLTIDNINTVVFQEIVNLFNDPEMDGLFENNPALENKLKDQLQQLFASSPALSLDNFQWQTDKASSNLKSNIAFKPAQAESFADISSLVEQSIDEFQMDLVLVKSMLVDVLKTQFDDRSVQLFSMLFDHYAAKAQRLGLINITDQSLHTNMHYVDGALTLNGKSVSILELQERLGSILSP